MDFRGRSQLFIVAAILVFVALAILFLRVPPDYMYENISFAFDPSASRAFAYGEQHFSSASPDSYDVGRAEYFFNIAVAKDPTLLYVHHELARISFLHGEFPDAMKQINLQITMHGDTTPNSYYIRGLIEGFMGDYADSAKDYEHFLQFDPHDWAAINDYAWVLLKAGRAKDAEVATAAGIAYFPNNPWLLNSNATALYELKEYPEALVSAQKALATVQNLTEAEWLHAYPGNDPKIGAQGLAAFKVAVADNMHTIDSAIASSTVQSKVLHE